MRAFYIINATIEMLFISYIDRFKSEKEECQAFPRYEVIESYPIVFALLLNFISVKNQALWDPKISLGKFYFTTFQGQRQETPYMDSENFARILDILRNETPVYGNASTGSVTTQGEGVGKEESQ